MVTPDRTMLSSTNQRAMLQPFVFIAVDAAGRVQRRQDFPYIERCITHYPSVTYIRSLPFLTLSSDVADKSLKAPSGWQASLVSCSRKFKTDRIHQCLNSNTNKGNILVADDVEANRELLAGLLTSAGYNVLSAEDGKQALDIIHGGAVDLALLDVRMPAPTGFAVCVE